MELRTRVFELAKDYGYESDSALARGMGVSRSLVSKVRLGHRKINRAFIDGALRAFPTLGFNDLFLYPRKREPVEAAS